MKKPIIFLFLLAPLFVFVLFAATPSQIMISAEPFAAIDDHRLSSAQTYLLSALAGLSTVNQVASNSAAYSALDDRSLRIAQTYLLSQLAGNAVPTFGGSATNLALYVTGNAATNLTPSWSNKTIDTTSSMWLSTSLGQPLISLRADAWPNRGIYWGGATVGTPTVNNSWAFNSFQIVSSGNCDGTVKTLVNTDPRVTVTFVGDVANYCEWRFRETNFEYVVIDNNFDNIAYAWVRFNMVAGTLPTKMVLGTNILTMDLEAATQITAKTNVSVSGSISVTRGINSSTNSAVAPAAITFPATTVKWTNAFGINIVLYIDNSGVTGTTVLKNNQQIFSSLVGDMTLLLKPGDYFAETYTVGTPVGRWEPQ